jgi:ABC-type Fe3+/spermidine/putrescine transport system ATPase subunit
MVFQNYALYPHMSVFENMAFGLRLRKMKKPEVRERVDTAARTLELFDLLLQTLLDRLAARFEKPDTAGIDWDLMREGKRRAWPTG